MEERGGATTDEAVIDEAELEARVQRCMAEGFIPPGHKEQGRRALREMTLSRLRDPEGLDRCASVP